MRRAYSASAAPAPAPKRELEAPWCAQPAAPPAAAKRVKPEPQEWTGVHEVLCGGHNDLCAPVLGVAASEVHPPLFTGPPRVYAAYSWGWAERYLLGLVGQHGKATIRSGLPTKPLATLLAWDGDTHEADGTIVFAGSWTSWTVNAMCRLADACALHRGVETHPLLVVTKDKLDDPFALAEAKAFLAHHRIRVLHVAPMVDHYHTHNQLQQGEQQVCTFMRQLLDKRGKA